MLGTWWLGQWALGLGEAEGGFRKQVGELVGVGGDANCRLLLAPAHEARAPLPPGWILPPLPSHSPGLSSVVL